MGSGDKGHGRGRDAHWYLGCGVTGKICLRNPRPVRHEKVRISADLPAEEHNFYDSEFGPCLH